MIALKPKPQENSWLWLLKILTGVLVLVVILIHLVVNHLVVEGGLLSYADVVVYFSNPWIVFMETCFLVLVVSHSLLGMRSILLDLRPKAGLLRVVDIFLVLLGTGAVIYGYWLMRLIASRGTGV